MLMESKNKKVSKLKQKCKSKDAILAELSQLEMAQENLSAFLQALYPLVCIPITDCSIYHSLRFSAHEIRLKIEYRMLDLSSQLYK